MKKIIMTSLLVAMLLITGCGKKEENKGNNANGGNTGVVDTPVVEEPTTYEGLEFLNVGASNGEVSTIVINNTGRVLTGTKFTMRIMDGEGNTIVELTDEIDSSMETGTTLEVETKTDADLSKAVSIEYSVVQ